LFGYVVREGQHRVARIGRLVPTGGDGRQVDTVEVLEKEHGRVVAQASVGGIP
jgi:hypothetical protein